jgi:putative transposase
VRNESDTGAGTPSRRSKRPTRPRAGRLQQDRLHFAIWHMCRRFVTIRLSSLRRTYQRARILASPQCERILYEIWHRSADHDSWYVGHYILMPDHVHFFARPAIDARPMADWMQMWKSVSSRQVAAALAIKQPIWQAEYFDRYLRSTESYSAKWHSVEQNAVRAGLVEAVEAWPYRGTINDLMF